MPICGENEKVSGIDESERVDQLDELETIRSDSRKEAAGNQISSSLRIRVQKAPVHARRRTMAVRERGDLRGS